MSLPNQTISQTAMSYELPPKVVMVGDVMYDSVLFNLKVAEKNKHNRKVFIFESTFDNYDK